MGAVKFISRRLGFQGRIPVWATAVSFFIIIVSLTVAGGFRKEIRKGLSENIGDILVTSLDGNDFSEGDSINACPPYLPEIRKIPGVRSIRPVVFRSGIVKGEEDIYGVIVKGVEDTSRESLSADIPEKLARSLKLSPGDKFTAYFIGEKVKARKFTVRNIDGAVLNIGENMVITVPIGDIRRVNGWEADKAGALEITLDENYSERSRIRATAIDISALAMSGMANDSDPVVAVSSDERYGQLFDWLDLIDFNVGVVLALMIMVAGFNMISGLLIMLFRNIRTIGILKSMGMTDRSVAGVFLRVSGRAVAKGMLAGNAAALLFCLIQNGFHLIRLNPQNYFIPFVPISINPAQIIAVDAVAFVSIMVLLLIPSLFISGIDPAKSIRTE